MSASELDAKRGKMGRVLALVESVIGTPEPHTPADPLDELVATILSQNTSDTNSRRAFHALKTRFPTWRAARDTDRDSLMDAISVGGLADTKARTIQEVLSAIEEVDGEPSLAFLSHMSNEAAVDALAKHRGIGVKTAACVLVFALDRDVCPVDTHVHRVTNRIGLVETRDRDRTYADLAELIPQGQAYAAHVLFVRFGRRVCVARNPKCHECPVFHECAWDERAATAAAHVDRASRKRGRALEATDG